MREFTVPSDRHFGHDDLIPVFARRSAAELPRTIPFEHHHGGQWRPVTMAAFVRRVEELAAGLVASGVRPGDRVALMSSTRYEWVLVDMAVWTAGAVTVPVYPSSAPAQLEWIIRDSGAGILIAEGAEHAATVEAAGLGDSCAEVLYIDDGDLDLLRDRGTRVEVGQVDEALATLTPESAASIIYTSGTTGRPKGCVITHDNLLSECYGLLDHPIGTAGKKGKKTLMFLPLAHVLARAVTYTAFLGGATIGFWGDTSTIVQVLGEFRPHMILGVPRVFEKVRDGIAAKARQGGRARELVFARAEKVAIEHSRAMGGDGLGDRRDESLLAEVRHKAYDMAVYRAVRDALGGRCIYAISGGGALPDDVAHFFRGLGVPVYEGYGLTESTAAITVNGPGCQRIGSVGRPIRGSGVRLAEDGEIMVNGRTVFDHYWENPEATEAALSGGWFATGDLGAFDEDGYLTITGRKKDILVTAGGKNVVPGPMEARLRAHRLVGEAVVIGEGRRFVSALLSLEPDALAEWAEENDKGALSPELLVQDPALRAELQYAVDEANELVSHAEGIKKFVLLPQAFSEAGGELTATHKVKRHVVEERYSREIEGMYR